MQDSPRACLHAHASTHVSAAQDVSKTAATRPTVVLFPRLPTHRVRAPSTGSSQMEECPPKGYKPAISHANYPPAPREAEKMDLHTCHPTRTPTRPGSRCELPRLPNQAGASDTLLSTGSPIGRLQPNPFISFTSSSSARGRANNTPAPKQGRACNPPS